MSGKQGTKSAKQAPPKASVVPSKGQAKGATSKAGATRVPAPMTKRQLSKHQREQQRQQLILAAVAILALVIIAIPLFGWWQESHRGESAVAKVAGRDITIEDYAKVMGLQGLELDAGIAQYQSLMGTQTDPTATATDYLYQYASQQVQQLQSQKQNLESNVLDEMIATELVRNETTKLGLAVTQQEVDDWVFSNFAPASTPTSTASVTTTEGITATGGATTTTALSPTAATTTTSGVTSTQPATTTAKQPTLDDARANLSQFLTSVGLMSEKDYMRLVIEPTILRSKYAQVLATTVPTTSEQVHVRHILLDTEELAKDIMSRLQAGADFLTLVKDESLDPNTRDDEGDLGWFGRGAMIPEFEAAAFAVEPGQIYTGIISTVYGFHIIQGIERDANRPLTEAEIEEATAQAYDDWLTKAKAEPNVVQYYFGWDQIKWARDYVDQKTRAFRLSSQY